MPAFKNVTPHTLEYFTNGSLGRKTVEPDELFVLDEEYAHIVGSQIHKDQVKEVELAKLTEAAPTKATKPTDAK